MKSVSTEIREPLYGAAWSTPMGMLVTVASDEGLLSVGWDLEALAVARQVPNAPLRAFEDWWKAYLGKAWDSLPEVPLDARGSPADLQVWDAIKPIRPGRTLSYADIARKLGKAPNAARSIGAAVGRNPIAIVVPCHRVIGASGSLTGYAGGVSRKAWLLKHEGVLLL